MAYGDNSQYGNFSFQSDPNFLSNIMAMAQARKQQQQQQQQQMVQAALQLANREGWLQSGRAAAPEGMSANQATYMNAANAAPSDAQKLRIMAYGPSQGEYTHDTNYGPLGALRQGDVAVSPNLKARFPLGSRIVVAGQPYRVADWSYYHPGEPTSNTVEIWNGQDMGYQPVQSFARGGVASWTDPYGNEPLAAQQYVHNVPMADVSGIAAAIMRQNQQKQEMYQQNVQNALAAANKIMEKRRTDAIGQALLQNDTETANDPVAASMVSAGASPMEAYKLRKQQISDENSAQQQATNDWYRQHDLVARENARIGLDPYGQKLPQGVATQGGKEWWQDPDGQWHLVTGNFAAKQTVGATNPYEERYKMFTTPDVVTYWNKDYSKKISTQDAESNPDSTIAVLPDKTTMPYTDYKKMAGQVVGRYYANKAPTDNPSDNQTGTAPPVTTAKQLDAATAKQFLDQAGGDKNKARQLAQAAGYTF